MAAIYRDTDRADEVRRRIYEERQRKRRRRALVGTLGITLLTLLALFFALAGIVMIYSRNMTSEEVMQTVAEGGEAKSISFSESRYYLSPGMDITLKPVTVPVNVTSEIIWETSDEAAAVVDSGGNVTAIGSGNAIITASSAGHTARAEVIVTENIEEAAVSAVLRLASEAEAYDDVCLFREKIDRDGDIYRVVASATEDGYDQAELTEAAVRCGVDTDAVLTAALTGRLVRESRRHAAVLSFTGDVTLARFNESGAKGRFPQVYEASGSYTYPFDRVKSLFGCDDLTVVNFEGTLTNSIIHKSKQFYFRGDPAYAGILTASGIQCAGLENNHSEDYYALGKKETKRFLSAAGISTFDAEDPLTVTLSTPSGAVSAVMLSYMQTGGEAPAQGSLDKLCETISSYRQETDWIPNIVIVNCHWGREGSGVPEQWQQDAAHRMIDSGADLVIGHHPHAVQGIECYNGRYIAYSLGNFAFGGNSRVNYPESMILRAYIDSGDGETTVSGIEIIPCLTTSTGTEINNYQPVPCFGGEYERVRGVINERSRMLQYGYGF